MAMLRITKPSLLSKMAVVVVAAGVLAIVPAAPEFATASLTVKQAFAGNGNGKGSPHKQKPGKSKHAGKPMKVHHGGPPPWAPAHGYRRHKGQTVAYMPPFGIDIGQCHRREIGAVIGAVAGGAAGSQIGKGSGNTAAIIGGTILGALIGGSIGQSMDNLDQNCVGQVLEHGSDGVPVQWQNPDGGTYAVEPVNTRQNASGQYCREYQTTATVGGRSQQTYGTACRQPDGSWKLVS
jgi:surface antigen